MNINSSFDSLIFAELGQALISTISTDDELSAGVGVNGSPSIAQVLRACEFLQLPIKDFADMLGLSLRQISDDAGEPA